MFHRVSTRTKFPTIFLSFPNVHMKNYYLPDKFYSHFVMFNHLEIVINSVKSWYFLHFHIKPLKKKSQHPRILKLFQTWKAQNKIILIFPLSKFTIRWKPCNIITSYKHHPSRLAISRLYCLFSSHFLGYIHMFLWPVSSIGRSRHLFPLSE